MQRESEMKKIAPVPAEAAASKPAWQAPTAQFFGIEATRNNPGGLGFDGGAFTGPCRS